MPGQLAYNLRNLWRRLALPKRIENLSLTSLPQPAGKDGRAAGATGTLLLAAVQDPAAVRAAMLGRIALLPVPIG